MANIIRGPGAPPPSGPSTGTRIPPSPKGGKIDSEVYDARSQAARIIQEAEHEAQELKARAQQEYQRALEEGRRQGYEAGTNEAAQLLAEARALREKLIRETEPQLIKLALKVAEKIIGHELDHNKDEIAQIVGNALETVRQQRDIIIRVHPTDLKNLEQAKAQLIARLGRAKDIDLRGDQSIKRGGCIIDTEIGTIDAQLETQLEQITNILLGGRAR
jgi:type III secretion protein L